MLGLIDIGSDNLVGVAGLNEQAMTARRSAGECQALAGLPGVLWQCVNHGNIVAANQFLVEVNQPELIAYRIRPVGQYALPQGPGM